MEIFAIYCENRTKKKTHTQCALNAISFQCQSRRCTESPLCCTAANHIIVRILKCSVSQTFLLSGPFWLRKITKDPHILAHVNIACPENRYPKFLKMCTSEMIWDSDKCKNAWRDLALITTTVANFVGTGSFLIRHSKGQINISPINEAQRLF